MAAANPRLPTEDSSEDVLLSPHTRWRQVLPEMAREMEPGGKEKGDRRETRTHAK